MFASIFKTLIKAIQLHFFSPLYMLCSIICFFRIRPAILIFCDLIFFLNLNFAERDKFFSNQFPFYTVFIELNPLYAADIQELIKNEYIFISFILYNIFTCIKIYIFINWIKIRLKNQTNIARYVEKISWIGKVLFVIFRIVIINKSDSWQIL